MKNALKSKAFVIQKYPYKESSFICHIFSPIFGKAKFILYSALKANKTNYQLGSIIEVDSRYKANSEWLQVYNSQLLSEVQLKDYHSFTLLSFILEWVYKCEFNKSSFQPIFTEYQKFYLKLKDLDKEMLFDFFYLFFYFTKLSGFSICWEYCQGCSKASYQQNERKEYIFRKENYGFDFLASAMLCSQCYTEKDTNYDASYIKLFFSLQHCVEQLNVDLIPKNILVSSLTLLIRAYLYHYPIKLKSLQNLENLLQNF